MLLRIDWTLLLNMYVHPILIDCSMQLNIDYLPPSFLNKK